MNFKLSCGFRCECGCGNFNLYTNGYLFCAECGTRVLLKVNIGV